MRDTAVHYHTQWTILYGMGMLQGTNEREREAGVRVCEINTTDQVWPCEP